jgi:hypothetical protein
VKKKKSPSPSQAVSQEDFSDRFVKLEGFLQTIVTELQTFSASVDKRLTKLEDKMLKTTEILQGPK